jgi:hypothetical protein
MDWTAVAAIAGCIAAVAATATLVVLWSERRSRLRSLDEAAAKLWSLEIAERKPHGVYLMRLRLHDARDNRLHLLKIRIVKSHGLMLAEYKHRNDGRAEAANSPEFVRTIHLERFIARLNRMGIPESVEL